MGCALQLVLLLIGGWMASRSRIRFGAQELRTPYTILAGIVLISQLPVGVGVGFAMGGAYSIRAMRDGLDPSVEAARKAKQYWWLDLVIPGLALAGSGLVIAAGLRRPALLPPPPDEPIGVTDFRALMADRWDPDPNRDALLHHQVADRLAVGDDADNINRR